MKRLIEKELVEWKKLKSEKMPMLIYGPRQVGKTYIINEFAEKYYENSVYVNFDADITVSGYFSGNITPEYIIPMLEKYYDTDIKPNETLIIFDQIQACERALASLKYFAESGKEYDVIGAGSLLGVAVKREKYNFPVGKVMIKHMYPMNFEEFLWSQSEEMLAELIKQSYISDAPLPETLHNHGLNLYKDYLIVGGMPAVVANHCNNDSTIENEVLRKLIVEAYTSDMAKYASASENIRTRSAYQTIPAQLTKENKKFQYKLIKKGARSSLYGDSIDWLIHAGVVLKCAKIESGLAPIAGYEDLSSFKLYNSDVGLLCQQANMTRYSLEQSNTNQFIGGVTENYVACELKHNGWALYYWESEGRAELDFIIEDKGIPVPIEVKSSRNNRSRSLSEFVKRYKPPYSVRISSRNFGYENNIKSVPLYAVFCIEKSQNMM